MGLRDVLYRAYARRLSRQLDLNGAIVKAAALHDRERLAIRGIGQCVEANRGLAQVSRLGDRTSVGLQLLRRLRAQRCGQQASKQVFHHQLDGPARERFCGWQFLSTIG